MVRTAQRPDAEASVVAHFDTIEQMNLFQLKQNKSELLELPPTLDINHMGLEALAWYRNELHLAESKLKAELLAISVLHDAVNTAI